MTGFILDAIRAGTRTALRKRPEPMQMLLIWDLLFGKRDETMVGITRYAYTNLSLIQFSFN